MQLQTSIYCCICSVWVPVTLGLYSALGSWVKAAKSECRCSGVYGLRGLGYRPQGFRVSGFRMRSLGFIQSNQRVWSSESRAWVFLIPLCYGDTHGLQEKQFSFSSLTLHPKPLTKRPINLKTPNTATLKTLTLQTLSYASLEQPPASASRVLKIGSSTPSSRRGSPPKILIDLLGSQGPKKAHKQK